MIHLLTIADAAAQSHGHLIRVGRSVRIPEAELEELIDKCRCPPKVLASTCESALDDPPSMSSLTVAPKPARAQQIAQRLKSTSRPTSPRKTAEVVPLTPR